MTLDLNDSIAELRRLNLPVPRPRRLPVESEVRAAEQLAGVAFHHDLRRYLLGASDVVCGTIEPVTIGGGHTDFGTVLRAARDAGVPIDLVPVCEDNGDYYCIAPSGEVQYWSHNGSTDESWPDLASWIVEVWIGDR
ncbi:MAG: SMI1/KNR4 family protein [Actinomycetia bacterium]|nr:SMI1/KNR4 family protein [Actinomycetes bacterium]